MMKFDLWLLQEILLLRIHSISFALSIHLCFTCMLAKQNIFHCVRHTNFALALVSTTILFVFIWNYSNVLHTTEKEKQFCSRSNNNNQLRLETTPIRINGTIPFIWKIHRQAHEHTKCCMACVCVCVLLARIDWAVFYFCFYLLTNVYKLCMFLCFYKSWLLIVAMFVVVIFLISLADKYGNRKLATNAISNDLSEHHMDLIHNILFYLFQFMEHNEQAREQQKSNNNNGKICWITFMEMEFISVYWWFFFLVFGGV